VRTLARVGCEIGTINMLSRSHVDALFGSADAALDRALIMANHRGKERRTQLANIRREMHLAQQNHLYNQRKERAAVASPEDAAGDIETAMLDPDGAGKLTTSAAESLRAECNKLRGVVDRMASQLQTVVVSDDSADDGTAGASTDHLLLPHLADTLGRVRKALPGIASQLRDDLRALFRELAFAAILHDGGNIDALSTLDPLLGREEEHALRLQAVHLFLTTADSGDAIGTAPPSVVRSALHMPNLRSALADRAGDIARAVDAYRRERAEQPASSPSSVPAVLRRMKGVLPAVANATLAREPQAAVAFVRNMVAPILLPQLDVSSGSAFDNPAHMHVLLYEGTLRDDLNTVAAAAEKRELALANELPLLERAAEDASAALEAVPRDAPKEELLLAQRRKDAAATAVETNLRHVAACVVLADSARSLLYRVLMSIEAFVERRRSLRADTATTTTLTNVALATSSIGAASSHRALLSLIDDACTSAGLAMVATHHQLAGHDVHELHRGDDVIDVSRPQIVSFYTHKGAVFSARHRAGVLPPADSFRKLDGGVEELVRSATATLSSAR
jgi:hypothetical protein